MRGIIENVRDQFMKECDRALEVVEKEAGYWRSMLGTVVMVLAVGGLVIGVVNVDTSIAAGSGAVGTYAAGFRSAYCFSHDF